MNEKLEFTHKYYNKYNTIRINIENGSLKLKEEDFRIINEIEKNRKNGLRLSKSYCRVGTT